MSTVLFAALGTSHIAVTPVASEIELIREYCQNHDIDSSGVQFVAERSGAALPALESVALDLLFIDGSHGFPAPIVDWYFGAAMLRKSGLLVVDDVGLPAVRLLIDFLDADQRWVRHERHKTWGSWARLSSGSLDEDWWEQAFYSLPVAATDVPRAVGAFVMRRVRSVRRKARAT